MPIPEGFIMPTLGTSLGGSVLKAVPTAEAIAGAMGTMSAEIKRHREYNAKRTEELVKENLPGEMTDEIEVVLITADKYTKVPLRASNLTSPELPFHNELSIDQQVSLADLRERFRKNEHGSDTPLASWEALSAGEQGQLIAAGILYVEQLAAYKVHEYYKLGNGGAELVKRAIRHVEAKTPNRAEEMEKNMQMLLSAKAEERDRADAAEKRMFEMQEQLAALQAGEGKKAKPRTPGVQESTEG